jgi:hypothetical protein
MMRCQVRDLSWLSVPNKQKETFLFFKKPYDVEKVSISYDRNY